MTHDMKQALGKILNSQQRLFTYHLPDHILQRMTTPARHEGINSLKFDGGSSNLRPPIIVAHGYGSGLGFFFACIPSLLAQGRTVCDDHRIFTHYRIF